MKLQNRSRMMNLMFFSSRRRNTSFDCDWSSDVCSSDLLASAIAGPSLAQEKPQEQQQERRKLSGDERKELEALIALVDAVAAGKQPAPADAKLKFQHHFIRSAQNVYIPYTLEIGGAKFGSFPIAMYVRATQKSGTA